MTGKVDEELEEQDDGCIDTEPEQVARRKKRETWDPW